MRRRVYRLYQPLTLLGLELWHLPLLAFGFVLGMRLLEPVHSALGLLGGGIVAYLFLQLAERVRERYPGSALLHELTWISQGDHYLPQSDLDGVPLLLPAEEVPTKTPISKTMGVPINQQKAQVSR
jgi:hypothetical protein